MRSSCFLLVFLPFVLQLSAQMQSPDEFLTHGLGEHFTPHHQLVDYYQHIAEESDAVKLAKYGRTNQNRPLLYAIITSPANHERIEDIRTDNLKRAGVLPGEASLGGDITIVWLSFGVHGNEAACSESSMQILFDLADKTNVRTQEWLQNTVVIIDPVANPDGYSRYTHWARDIASDDYNPDIQDVEHQEPWPGGRVNHYLFDLNRDWVWQTQTESQQRIRLYNDWLPHIHADFHEMGHESPYFFAPASKPFHKYITQWQRDFQTEIGKNHARYFDAEGWLYFTKEVFDLLYPSYGDTYPTYSGAIGMTYEQGGSHVAGRAIRLENGELLTLKDRIAHHVAAALSTVEIASRQSSRLVQQFETYYKGTSTNPPGDYRTYVIKKDPSGRRLDALADLLAKQDITYAISSESSSLAGHLYSTQQEGMINIEPGDMVVSALQPKAVMTQVLLDPVTELEDSLTYDITAWSLPYAYGLEALASTKSVKINGMDMMSSSAPATTGSAYAYLIPWSDVSDAAVAADLLHRGVSVRTLSKPSTLEGRSYGAGSLVVTRADNRSIDEKLIGIINEVASSHNAEIISVKTGFAESGLDLGSGRIDLIKKPKALLLMSDRIRTNAFGQVKWYFDRVIDYPLTIVDRDRLSRTNMSKYNTMILTSGYYGFSKSERDQISSWVRGGGKLIVIGGALSEFADQDGFALKRYATDEDASKAKKASQQANLDARYNDYEDRERDAISDYVPGAIFRLDVDESHPLGFGLGDHYYSLRTSSSVYPLLVNENNVFTHPKDGGASIGFAGSKIKERIKDSVVFAVEDAGRGTVIYMVDNPLFRGFWYNGLFLFSNALFQVQ